MGTTLNESTRIAIAVVITIGYTIGVFEVGKAYQASMISQGVAAVNHQLLRDNEKFNKEFAASQKVNKALLCKIARYEKIDIGEECR